MNEEGLHSGVFDFDIGDKLRKQVKLFCLKERCDDGMKTTLFRHNIFFIQLTYFVCVFIGFPVNLILFYSHEPKKLSKFIITPIKHQLSRNNSIINLNKILIDDFDYKFIKTLSHS